MNTVFKKIKEVRVFWIIHEDCSDDGFYTLEKDGVTALPVRPIADVYKMINKEIGEGDIVIDQEGGEWSFEDWMENAFTEPTHNNEII